MRGGVRRGGLTTSPFIFDLVSEKQSLHPVSLLGYFFDCAESNESADDGYDQGCQQER